MNQNYFRLIYKKKSKKNLQSKINYRYWIGWTNRCITLNRWRLPYTGGKLIFSFWKFGKFGSAAKPNKAGRRIYFLNCILILWNNKSLISCFIHENYSDRFKNFFGQLLSLIKIKHIIEIFSWKVMDSCWLRIYNKAN